MCVCRAKKMLLITKAKYFIYCASLISNSFLIFLSALTSTHSVRKKTPMMIKYNTHIKR